MHLPRNNNLALFMFWIFLTVHSTRWNRVKAAVILDAEYLNAPKNTCGNICRSQICYKEANRLESYIDKNIDPCDDFFQFTCGKLFRSPKLNKSTEWDYWNLSSEEQKLIYDQTYTAINEIDSNYPEAIIKMQTFYRNCMNQSEGIDSILRILNNIGGFPMLVGSYWNEAAYDWKEALYKIIDENIFISFPVFILGDEQDSDPSKNIPVVMSAQTNAIDKHNRKTIYDFIIESVIALGGNNSEIVKREVEELVNFLIKLHNIKSNDKELRKQTKNETKVPMSVLAQNYPNIPWLKLLNKILNRHDFYIHSSDFIDVYDRKFINNIEDLINITPRRVIANFLAWNVLTVVYPFLPKPFTELNLKYNQVRKPTTRKEFCLMGLKDSFSLALSSLYVRKYEVLYFHDDMKKDVENIVNNIKNQIKTDIQRVKWMDNKTKAAALKKISAMHNLIGYKKELLDDEKINEFYKKLEITSGSFLKSRINLTAFGFAHFYESLKVRPTKISWTTKESEINFNDHYDYLKNAIDIPSVYLHSRMYTYGRPRYLNFGALGSIIGHEIMHGFDSRGRNYDDKGMLNNWWYGSTEQKYLQKIQCLIDQFNNFTIPKTNLTLNGEKTKNEDIADNGGFKAAYHAYNKWLERNNISEECLPNLNYSPKQMFWISSSTNWCSVEGIEHIRNMINTDPHTPDYARVILSFSNIKEFAEDFKCKAGSRMNPEKKCSIW